MIENDSVAMRRRKAELRAVQRAALAALVPAVRNAASERIRAALLDDARVRAARTVFTYVSTPVEPDTRKIIDDLIAHSIRVLVPLLHPTDGMRAVDFPGWTSMNPGALGILTPQTGPAWSGEVDLALVPGLAFDRAGGRLGHGRAYYDRWLATHRPRLAIGVAFELQIVDALPLEMHDVPLPLLVTESGLHTCDGRR